jgi:type II secretory pathway component PulM
MMKTENTNQNLKDVSRFTRWVNNLDTRDQSLTPRRRKRKWILLTGGIFILFVLSFLLFPSANPGSSKVITPKAGIESQGKEPAAQSAFDLPVDSFENHLKSIIHEELSEKK